MVRFFFCRVYISKTTLRHLFDLTKFQCEVDFCAKFKKMTKFIYNYFVEGEQLFGPTQLQTMGVILFILCGPETPVSFFNCWTKTPIKQVLSHQQPGVTVLQNLPHLSLAHMLMTGVVILSRPPSAICYLFLGLIDCL